ncbi:MAG: RNA polymerase sigma factor [Verrucomicrobia subdivision 3 bacterium]|nr:RNA polymerase sigma factor [Limisphaerales bacterium]
MTGHPDAQDAIAMADLAADRDHALDCLMERHAEKLFHYLIRVLQNHDDAAEVAQEAFVRVYEHRAKFNPEQKFTTWLYTIATNLARDRMRWRSRHLAVSLEALSSPPSLNAAHPELSPSEQLESSELLSLIRGAVAGLPEDLRVPFVLAQYENLSQAQIAAILKCSVKAVETRVYRARKLLRERLAQFV